ncbi:hypothetical protein IE81DRAFT_329274 [Ceraceosorus guamensis]|uniref:Uncharacterized protein n=1 Tax=Ceraceosorus guamensis TaxID=1522189 RepID=A0A316W195_9BASI|nr:hypothetical protein IE81DRAFT_329274 [Ceraceosorus guamensis]PWN43677.1 hypothetical protein IE81DRAFT_329274 [Ceraceosorus guamensis]
MPGQPSVSVATSAAPPLTSASLSEPSPVGTSATRAMAETMLSDMNARLAAAAARRAPADGPDYTVAVNSLGIARREYRIAPDSVPTSTTTRGMDVRERQRGRNASARNQAAQAEATEARRHRIMREEIHRAHMQAGAALRYLVENGLQDQYAAAFTALTGQYQQYYHQWTQMAGSTDALAMGTYTAGASPSSEGSGPRTEATTSTGQATGDQPSNVTTPSLLDVSSLAQRAGMSIAEQQQQQAFARAQYQANVRAQEQAAHAAAQRQRETRRVEAQHKVYLINCRHCGVMFTNRGMKAVLLLRPNITLYSTDAFPDNTEPHHAPSGLGTGEAGPQRTCDCMTQSLACKGCHQPIGYMIMSPCSRCTSSVSKAQRGSNGHRTVLHCTEITVRERRYVPGEAGVYACPPAVAIIGSRSRRPARDGPLYYADRGVAPIEDDIPMDEDECTDDEEYDSQDEEMIDDASAEAAKAEEALSQARAQADQLVDEFMPRRPQSRYLPQTSLNPSKEATSKPLRRIKRGETLYWNDLAACGECPTPFDSDLALEMWRHGQ